MIPSNQNVHIYIICNYCLPVSSFSQSFWPRSSRMRWLRVWLCHQKASRLDSTQSRRSSAAHNPPSNSAVIPGTASASQFRGVSWAMPVVHEQTRPYTINTMLSVLSVLLGGWWLFQVYIHIIMYMSFQTHRSTSQINQHNPPSIRCSRHLHQQFIPMLQRRVALHCGHLLYTCQHANMHTCMYTCTYICTHAHKHPGERIGKPLQWCQLGYACFRY